MPIEEAIEIIKKHTIEFVWWESKIQKSLTDKTICGINARASSLIRLRFTIERVRRIIEENGLPLVVQINNSHLNHFRII